MESRLWSIVLVASGRPFSASHEGGSAQAHRRLAPICPADRTVFVLDESQRNKLPRLPEKHESGRMVFQPDDRGTAAGLLFGLLPVLATDPAAVVLVTRSNQAVENTDAFQRGIGDAVRYARHRFGIVLFGAEPTRAPSDCRWVSVSSVQNSTVSEPVVSFVETRLRDVAEQVPSAGAGWNTFAIVAPARALLHLYRQRLPVVSGVFVAALTMPPETQRTFLAAQYPQLPSRDFAQHVLMTTGNRAAHSSPPSISGSDLRTPEQPERWLRRVSTRELPTMTAESHQGRRDSFPAKPSFGQVLGFVVLMLSHVIAMIFRGFHAVYKSARRPVSVWK